jgi:hypothetical protein
MAQKFSIDQNIILKAAIAVGVYFFVIKPITDKLNLTDSPEDKKEEKEQKEADKILEKQESKINIWQGVEAVKRAAGANNNITILNYAGAAAKADNINDSFSIFNDDEERIYASFRSLNAQTQVASIVDQYRIRHKADLLNALKTNLNTTELNEISKIINQKPIGITKKS